MELPHEPHIKAKNEEFWRLEGRQELDQLETLLDQLGTLLENLGTILDQLGTLLDQLEALIGQFGSQPLGPYWTSW